MFGFYTEEGFEGEVIPMEETKVDSSKFIEFIEIFIKRNNCNVYKP